jgi:uncharacterized protein
MKHLCDANVFLAIAVEQHSGHETAARWFIGLERNDTAVFCRATQNSFLRLLTRKISEHYVPVTNRKAWEAYDKLCQDETLIFVEEPAGLERIWRKLASPSSASPKLWMDAYLASFAIAGGFRMVTFDRDFRSFEPHRLNLLILQS